MTVDVLVPGPAKLNPTELLDSGRMSAVLERIPERYDLVIVDAPPVGVVSDALPMLDRVDGVVVNGYVPNDEAYGYYQAIGSD